MTAPLSPQPTRAPRQQVSAGTAFGLLYRTLLRSVRTRGRLIAIAVLAGLAILSGAIRSGDDYIGVSDGIDQAILVLTLIVALAALLISSAVLGDLYDNGSIVYLALRPVPTWVIAAAAWAASCTIVAPVAVVGVLSVGLVHSGDGLISATSIAALVGLSAYVALFVFMGVLVRRALPLGLAYLLLWEGFVSLAGDFGAGVAIIGYLRSILAGVTGEDIDFAPFTTATGVLVPLVLTAVLIFGTGRLLDRRELP